jgi:protein disulfide-isomerase-like protein
MKLVKSIFSEKNMPKLLFSVVILLILYYVYTTYLKEGFESVDLDEETKKGKQLVLFYADWCGHCKKIKPVWDETADEINDKDKNKKMLKVNCGGGSEKEKEIMEKYNIDGYPTIILFTNGKPSPYEGARNKHAFIEALS